MNYELLKAKMDKFFKETSPSDLISKFEALGYEFTDISISYTPVKGYDEIVINCDPVHVPWYRRNRKSHSDKIKTSDLVKYEVFFLYHCV